MSYIYGPVPSRRLGRSLGIDLVPFKTCSYDCIYCQLGRTTNKSIERLEWIPLNDVLTELRDKLVMKPDYITLSGSGEPTLYSRLDELIGHIRAMTDIPVAVLTNGSLLWQPALRRQLLEANLVVPSLDAGDNTMFQAINRPHGAIHFERMLEGLIDFRHEFKGGYWLEVFLLAGHNIVQTNLQRIINCVKSINPDRVQLNTVTRPATEDYASQVPLPCLVDICGHFSPAAEVIADYRGVHEQSDFKTGHASVLEMILRRPCSIEDITAGLSMHRNEVIKYVETLVAKGHAEMENVNGRVYYRGKHDTITGKSKGDTI